jgi:hypothetical protein
MNVISRYYHTSSQQRASDQDKFAGQRVIRKKLPETSGTASCPQPGRSR